MLQKKLAVVLLIALSLLVAKPAALGQNPTPIWHTAASSVDTALHDSFNSESSSIGSDPESTSAFVGRPPITRVRKIKEKTWSRPFSALALGFKANTLGAGVEMATPLARSFNLRASANLFDFGYVFNIDGLDYNSKLHFRSAQLTLDWFPKHGRFHISPGILYARNTLSAIAGVPPGQYFELGAQGLTDSVDDPLAGTASVTFPHKIAPMLLAGFGNIIPRSGKHLSVPVEFGFALTGQPHMSVQLTGTACTNDGCFDVAKDPESQQSLAAEIAKLNNDLNKIPVYPIVSLGVAYRF